MVAPPGLRPTLPWLGEDDAPTNDPPQDIEVQLSVASMGGTLSLRLTCPPRGVERARRDLRRVADRVNAWAARLTRFSHASDLSALNRRPDEVHVRVRPTLGHVLERAHGLAVRTEGMVDVSLLSERVAAEAGTVEPREHGRWWIESGSRYRILGREGQVRFDLDGVAKGWLADRALAMLRDYRGAMVDADGDVALRVPHDSDWQVAVADPDDPTTDLAVLSIPGAWPARTLGVATSGTSVHRWTGRSGPTHHLIDPRTRLPAQTDVVQASVVAESALVAEALAKSAVIAGSDEGLAMHERSGAWATVLLLEDGDVIASPRTVAWLA